MSTVWNIRCETCDIDGPKICRSAGGVSLLDDAVSVEPLREGDHLYILPTWGAFLTRHEFHDLRVRHE